MTPPRSDREVRDALSRPNPYRLFRFAVSNP
jgi:hypothetical protein